MEKHCLNLEDLSKGMADAIKYFLKKTGGEDKENCETKSDNLSSKYKCHMTGKMCVANFIEPNEGKTIEYNENIAKRCPLYIPPQD